MPERSLFGGAFSAEFPGELLDVSVIRQVPDNQEVFSHPSTDQSLIIEILEYVDPQEPDEVAIKTHFEELATANGAQTDSLILQTEQISPENISMAEAQACYYVLGEQNISKFNEEAKNTVNLHIGLFRLPQFSTDILITFNDPINISLESSSHKDVSTSVQRWLTDDFRTILSTFKLNDTSIFGL